MPPESQTPPLDPALLATFRQQGAAILARERGLSPACRIKLTGIAQSLGIGDDQIEEAIRSLAAAEPAAPPNAQTERFRRRLRKDLAGKSRTIIGPTIESRIFAAAQRKFGLDAEAAGPILGEVAAELGLTRITASDAIQSLAAQIDQAAGDGTWLAREAWDRLRSAGSQWGLELEVIDAMIDERLAANRAEHARHSSRTLMTLYVAGGAVLAAGVILAGLALGRLQTAETAVTEPATASPGSAAGPSSAAKLPAWWDVDLSVEMAHAKSGLRGLDGAYPLMCSSSANERAAGYELLIKRVRAADKPALLSTAMRMLAGCHALEPDESAAARLRAALLVLVPSADGPLPADSSEWNIAFWAADAAAMALDRRGSTKERTAALADALSSALGGSLDLAMSRAERQRLLHQRTVLAAYRQLTAASSKHASAVAKLYSELSQRAAALLSDDELLQAETTFLLAALPAAGGDWKVYERPLVRCISSPDPLPSLRLLDVLRRASDEKLVGRLSELLLVRAGARSKSSNKKDIIIAVRQALSGDGTTGLTAADRWLSLQEEAATALISPAAADEAEVLSQTAQLAHLTTLAIAMAQGEGGFATFDAGLANPPQLDVTAAAADPILGLTSSGSTKATRRFTKSQQRDFTQFLETIDKHGDVVQPQRESAVKGLAALAGETTDISPQQAASLSRYLLAEKSSFEQTKALEAAGSMRHWKHLRLAAADQIQNAKLPPDQQRALAAALLGRDIEGEPSAAQLRRLLLANVLDELATAASGASVGSAELLDKAAETIAASYRQRAGLLGAASGVAAAQTPGQALEVCVASLAASIGSKQAEDDFAYELKAARYVAGDDLHYTVAMQQLFIERSSGRVIAQRPQHAAAARQIAAESLAASADAPGVLVQLRDQEAAALKLWMLYAPEI